LRATKVTPILELAHPNAIGPARLICCAGPISLHLLGGDPP